MIRLTALLALVLSLAWLGGCGSDDKPTVVDYPANAVFLQQNVPQKSGDYTLVAINIDEDGGIIVVTPPAGVSKNVPVKAGQTVTSGTLTLKVLGIEPPTGDSKEPGAGTGRIIVLPSVD